MIYENAYLIPMQRKIDFSDKTHYLLLATDVEAELSQEQNNIDVKLKDLRKKLTTSIACHFSS
jgi:hypothetical protein